MRHDWPFVDSRTSFGSAVHLHYSDVVCFVIRRPSLLWLPMARWSCGFTPLSLCRLPSAHWCHSPL